MIFNVKYYLQSYFTTDKSKVKVPDNFPDEPKDMTPEQIEEYKEILNQHCPDDLPSGYDWQLHDEVYDKDYNDVLKLESTD